jgi:hypothetical protein
MCEPHFTEGFGLHEQARLDKLARELT